MWSQLINEFDHDLIYLNFFPHTPMQEIMIAYMK